MMIVFLSRSTRRAWVRRDRQQHGGVIGLGVKVDVPSFVAYYLLVVLVILAVVASLGRPTGPKYGADVVGGAHFFYDVHHSSVPSCRVLLAAGAGRAAITHSRNSGTGASTASWQTTTSRVQPSISVQLQPVAHDSGGRQPRLENAKLVHTTSSSTRTSDRHHSSNYYVEERVLGNEGSHGEAEAAHDEALASVGIDFAGTAGAGHSSSSTSNHDDDVESHHDVTTTSSDVLNHHHHDDDEYYHDVDTDSTILDANILQPDFMWTGAPSALLDDQQPLPNDSAASHEASSANSRPQSADTSASSTTSSERRRRRELLFDEPEDRSVKELSLPSASGWMQLVAAINAANARRGQRTNFVILNDVTLQGTLPPLKSQTHLFLYSRCKDEKTGKPRSCFVHGSRKYTPAFSSDYTEEGVSMIRNCSLKVRGFVFSRTLEPIFSDLECKLTVLRCIFQHGRSQNGGSVLSYPSCLMEYSGGSCHPDAIFAFNTFKNNRIVGKLDPDTYGSRADRGGAVVHVGDARFDLAARLFFLSCNFINNTATGKDQSGGAIYAAGQMGFVYFRNCLFDGNVAGMAGGAIASAETSVTVVRSRFASNKSVRGDGQSIAVFTSDDLQVSICNSTFSSSKDIFLYDSFATGSMYYSGKAFFCGVNMKGFKITKNWMVSNSCPRMCKK